MKVSRPAEDICNHCFVFANRHRYLANHSRTETLAPMVTMAAAAAAAAAAATTKETTMTESTTANKNDDDGNTTAAATTTEAMDKDGNMTVAATRMEAMDDDGNMTAATTTTEATMKESTTANKDDNNGNITVVATTTEATDDNGNTTAAATMTEAMITESTMVDKDDNDNDNNGDTVVTTMEEMPAPISIDQPESAATEVKEAREQLLLDAAKQVNMARKQRARYQAHVAKTVCNTTDGKLHSERRYTFVVDYGQRMQVPIFNNEQPGQLIISAC